jgi:RNA polymerase sigma-70 factor (ECF subfamily)
MRANWAASDHALSVREKAFPMGIFSNRCGRLTDQKLMQGVQRRDTSAFDELYSRYSRRLLSYFHRELGGDGQKAQDFLQDLFLKIVEKPDSFDTSKNFSTWIFTVAYNMCKNEYRRLDVRRNTEENVRMEQVTQHSEAHGRNPEQRMDQDKFETALLAELQELGDGHRSAFLLRHQQNLSIKEIAEVLGCSEGTVKSRLFYATQKLAARLKAFNPYPTEVSKNEKSE